MRLKGLFLSVRVEVWDVVALLLFYSEGECVNVEEILERGKLSSKGRAYALLKDHVTLSGKCQILFNHVSACDSNLEIMVFG